MAIEDPYKLLGIARTASADDIRRAFRAAAKKHHPDLHPGDATAEARFKALSAANELLSDPERRGRFDRGEIDAEGNPAPDRTFYRDYAQQASGARYRQAGAPDSAPHFAQDDMDGLGAFFREQMNRPRAGRDRSYTLDVAFLDAVLGATQRLTLPDGTVLDVRIPPGLEDGQVLRLRAKGEPGANGGPAGDALIEVSVLPSALYRRDGADLTMDLPVTFAKAVLGGKVDAPTPLGDVSLTVPPRSDTGTRLRLRGRGIAAHGGLPAGDLHVVLRVVVGPVDEALEAFLKDWPPAQAGTDVRADVRAGLGGGS